MARPVSEINAGSMADIAFLLLIFFLVTTTMDVDSGIMRKLPPLPDPTVEPPPVKKRNTFVVLVNAADQLLVNGKPGSIESLKEDTKEFLANPYDKEDLPEKRLEVIDYIGEYPVSKGIISLQNDRGTSYDMYIQVQNELATAIRELRNELSMQKFGVKFTALKDEELVKAIQKAIPVPISEAEPKDVGGTK